MLAVGRDVDLGSIPDWIAGIGTALSLLVLSAGLLWEIRRRRVDDEALVAERRDHQRLQANLIHLRVEPMEDFRVRFHVTNHSSLPIFRLRFNMHVVRGPENAGILFEDHEVVGQASSDIENEGGVAAGQRHSVTACLTSPHLGEDGQQRGLPERLVIDKPADGLFWGLRYSDTDEKYLAFWDATDGRELMQLDCSIFFADAHGRYWRVAQGQIPSRMPEKGLDEWFRLSGAETADTYLVAKAVQAQ